MAVTAERSRSRLPLRNNGLPTGFSHMESKVTNLLMPASNVNHIFPVPFPIPSRQNKAFDRLLETESHSNAQPNP